jgi:imidazolonepropionase-like amidohydrolase
MTRAESTGLPEVYAQRAATVWEAMRDGVRAAAAAGVLVGSGSDLVGPDQSARGRELVLRSELQDAMTALVSATSNNAKILRIDDQVGTIEVGKQADFVLWSDNPLESPGVFQDREAVQVVVKAGAIVRDTR